MKPNKHKSWGMRGDWWFFSSRGLIHHVALVSRSARSYVFSSATWCCLPIFTSQLSFKSTPISLHIMHVHKHADTHPRAALLLCRLYPLVDCAAPCPSAVEEICISPPDSCSTTHQCRAPQPHLYSPCPLSVTLHFSHCHAPLGLIL